MKRIYLLLIALTTTLLCATAQKAPLQLPPLGGGLETSESATAQKAPLQLPPLGGGLETSESATAQTTSPRSGGPRGGSFWTCPDTLHYGTITIDEEYINRKPGQTYCSDKKISLSYLGNYPSTYGSFNFGQSLVGGRGTRYTLESSEPILMLGYREWNPRFFIALPGQHLHVIRDASQGDSIVDIHENGRTILSFERREETTDFANALYRDYEGWANLTSDYIHERLIDCATNPDVARFNLQPYIDRPFENLPQGLSIGYSSGSFILRSRMTISDEEPDDDEADSSDDDENSSSSTGPIYPIFRKEHGGLSLFRAELESNLQLPQEDELPERGICTLIIDMDKKGEMTNSRIYHSFSPAFDAALTEAVRPLFPFDAPARVDGKPCDFRIVFNIIYLKHGTTREEMAAAANNLSVFAPFENLFTLPGVEIPLAVSIAKARVHGELLLPHWIMTDYGDYAKADPGVPQPNVYSKPYDAEPYATWFSQLEEQLKANLQLTQQQRDSIASAFVTTIDRYRLHAERLPSFYETIATNFNGNTRSYVDHIFKTSLLFNRRRFNRFREDLDHTLLFEDEGFNLLISLADFTKQDE